MLKFVFRRLCSLIPILLGVALVSSLLFYIMPGDIVRVMLGQHVDPYTYASVRKAMGLDIPFWRNFTGFLGGILHGDLGFSYIQQRPVSEIVTEALPVTFRITVMSLLITVCLGIPAGTVAAVKDKKIAGNVVNAGAVVGISLPSFLLALFLQLVFGVILRWLPISGGGETFVGYILPALAIGLPMAAFYARVTRASMLETMTSEYILFAFSRGLPYRRVIVRHGLRNAVIPVITQLGMDFGMFMTGVVLTETIFNLPGMGRLVYSAINARDFPVLRGLLLLFALIMVVTNLMVDLIYARVDPRMASGMMGEEPDGF